MPSDAEQLVRLKKLARYRETLAAWDDELTPDDLNAVRWTVRRIAELEGALKYLASLGPRIPARVTHCDHDPAGDTTEFEPDPRAVAVLGEENLWFEVGCGSSCYRWNGELSPAQAKEGEAKP